MYTRWTIGLVLAVALVGMSVSPEGANHEVTVTAWLDGGQETPGVVTGAHGSATVTLNRATGQVTFTVNVYNLPTGITAAHIHVGPPGVSGPVILDLKPVPGLSNDFGWSGTISASELIPRAAQGINSMDDALFSIASGVSYVNVHSQANPPGEIRGRLCPASAAANTFNGVNTCG